MILTLTNTQYFEYTYPMSALARAMYLNVLKFSEMDLSHFEAIFSVRTYFSFSYFTDLDCIVTSLSKYEYLWHPIADWVCSYSGVCKNFFVTSLVCF